MQRCLIRRQDHQVVGVPDIIPDTLDLFDPVVEIREVKIRKVLRQIVTDGKPGCAIDDLVEEVE